MSWYRKKIFYFDTYFLNDTTIHRQSGATGGERSVCDVMISFGRQGLSETDRQTETWPMLNLIVILW